ncbi:MAG: PASTA domain-containing protein, partial [Muribaculaceae bacterium]|nr:PASTA domain-containing protein [Muribaculaceae bacterium]
ASTSGMVLKNVALGLYSRGLLDNTSDYRADSPENPVAPTLFTTSDGHLSSVFESQFGVKSAVFKTPVKTSSGSVPDVLGMGLREAVATVEHARYNVRFTGSGHVSSQDPAPGTTLSRGATIKLYLSE